MALVLNEALYKRLKSAFGPVKVTNQGQGFFADDFTDPFADRKRAQDLHLNITQAGEYYAVNCPYCLDTRQRLYVNHYFGQKSNSGRKLNFLATCYNEGCMANMENRFDFNDKLHVLHGDLEKVIKPGKRVAMADRVVELPGYCQPLDELPKDHPARLYVRSRRFDPDRLAKVYGVSYCLDSMYFLARHRIIIPATWQGKLAGWQARYIGELDWKRKKDLPVKYYTMPGMARGSFLPNLDNARLFRTGVLVEGWFDVFGFGPMSMPILGGSVTSTQQSLFATIFGRPGRAGVLLLDPEEFDKMGTQKTIKALDQKMSGKLAAVKLPDGTDPGKLDRAFMRQYVIEAAADQGVKLDFGWMD